MYNIPRRITRKIRLDLRRKARRPFRYCSTPNCEGDLLYMGTTSDHFDLWHCRTCTRAVVQSRYGVPETASNPIALAWNAKSGCTR